MSDRFKILGKDIYWVQDLEVGWTTYYLINPSGKNFNKIQMEQTSTGGRMALQKISDYEESLRADLLTFVKESKWKKRL